MVADDEPALALLLEAVLSGAGFEVVAAADGPAAVSQYREKGPFGCVILDHQMPGMSGREAFAEIRKLDGAARAIVLSGEPLSDPDKPPIWAQGFDGYLSKPFDNDELVRAVKDLLGSAPE